MSFGNSATDPGERKGKRFSASHFALVGLVLFFILLPSILSSYSLYLMATVFATALLASSLNLILGYGGLMQLHHAVFYGIGAYAVAILMTKTSVPFAAAVFAAPFVAAGVAFLIGWFSVRLRGLYFGMLTLALGQLVWAIVYRWNTLTGGDDGIHAIPVPEAFTSLTASYYLTFTILVLSLVLLFAIVKSPFGLILTAARENSPRTGSIGVNVKRHQLAAFVISGFFAGIAGVLFVMIDRSVSPALLYWNKSAEVLIMCLMGGMGTFLGPSLGAALLVILSMVVGVYTEYWLLVLGLVLLVLVLFLPQGILGFMLSKFPGIRSKEVAQDAAR